jgi:hypothetical protein
MINHGNPASSPSVEPKSSSCLPPSMRDLQRAAQAGQLVASRIGHHRDAQAGCAALHAAAVAQHRTAAPATLTERHYTVGWPFYFRMHRHAARELSSICRGLPSRQRALQITESQSRSTLVPSGDQAAVFADWGRRVLELR